MATTEELEKEILAEMATDPVAYAAPVDDIITIDGESRVISVPASEILFGVETDKDVERKHFRCPKIVGDGIDLSKHQIYISYITSDSTGKSFSGDAGLYLCEDVAVDGDDITFSWQLSGNVFSSAGFIAFKVLAAKTDGENVQTRWNTVPAVGTVLMTVPDGMDIAETYPDIVTQLLERMASVEKIATEEAMQGYVNTYLEAHPGEIDETLTDHKKAAPADVVGELKEDVGAAFIVNEMKHLHTTNGSYDSKTGLFTPLESVPYFCGVTGLVNNHKYRVVFATAADVNGKVSLYILNTEGTWAASDFGGKMYPKVNEIMIYDIDWVYSEDYRLVVNTTENNNRWDTSGFYICIYDISELSEDQLNLMTTMNTRGFIFSNDSEHSKTTDNILNTEMLPRKINKNAFDSGQFDKFPIVIDSSQNTQTYLFVSSYMNGEKNNLSKGKFILALARLNISELTIKENASALEGLKYIFALKLSEYHNVYNSFFNTGTYVITNIAEITDDDKDAENIFIGISMDMNYTDYNSIISVEDVSYIIMTAEEKQKYMNAIVNAYSAGYDFPMLSLTCLEHFKNSDANEEPSWYSEKKYCAYGDSITAQDYYPYILKKKLGMSGYNRGVGGRAIYQMASDENIETIPDDSDVIIVMGGTNDWAQSIRLGEIDDSTTETFYGSLNIIAEKLSKKFPTKIIVFATTPYGLLPNNSNWTDQTGYKNNIGLTTGDYGKCIMDVARKHGFPCADVYGKCGWNKYNITEWINFDGGYLHTKQNGGYRIGEIICGTLKAVEPMS